MEMLTNIQSTMKRFEEKVDGMIETQGLATNATQQWQLKHSDAVREIQDKVCSAETR